MKLEYEKITTNVDASLKVGVYTKENHCDKVNWHFHPEYEIVYIKNGCGHIQIDNFITEYKDGTLIFLGPNTPHFPFGNKDTDDSLEIVIQFDDKFVFEKISCFPEFNQILKLINRSKKGMLFCNSLKENIQKRFEALQYISNPAEKLINIFQILIELSLSEAYITLKKEDNYFDSNSRDIERINYAFDYVQKNFAGNITTNIIAENLGLTTNSFCKLFKKTTQITFMQFVNDFKIRKAVSYMTDIKLSISEVMFKCGYNDPSYFTKQFKRVIGCTPSEYSSKIIKENRIDKII